MDWLFVLSGYWFVICCKNGGSTVSRWTMGIIIFRNLMLNKFFIGFLFIGGERCCRLLSDGRTVLVLRDWILLLGTVVTVLIVGEIDLVGFIFIVFFYLGLLYIFRWSGNSMVIYSRWSSRYSNCFRGRLEETENISIFLFFKIF